MIKLGAEELRVNNPTPEELAKIKRNPVYIIVDNVLDTYNIGAIFRLADAVSAEKVYLCGQTATPPYHKIHKASIGTWQWVPWQYCKTAKEAVLRIKNQESRIKVIAIEQSTKSIPYTKVDYSFPVAFILGHETSGVTNEALEAADIIAEIPMYGVNKSLNVMVSLAIILYKAMEGK